MGSIRSAVVRPDDLDEVHALFDRMHLATTGRPFPTSRQQLALHPTFPFVRPDVDLVAVLRGDDVVAAVLASPQPPYSELEYYPAVDPRLVADPADADEVVELLLAAVRASAAARWDEAGDDERLLVVGLPRDEPVATPRLAAHGFTYLRSLWKMEIDLADRPEPRPLPDGVRVEPYEASRDHDDMLAVVVESFADDGGLSEVTFDHALGVAHRVPEATLLARDGTGPVASVWGFERDATTGYVSTVGVLPRARGHGLATALLQRSFDAFAARGYHRVGLDVDADSTTGATHVYRRAGMSTVSVTDLWATPVG